MTAAIIREGAAAGVFSSTNPELTTNLLYAQTLGLLHSARLGIGVMLDEVGAPRPFAIEGAEVRTACVAAALSAVGAPPLET